jgi:hypothetical protein
VLENRLVEIVEKSTTAKQGHDLTDRRLARWRRARGRETLAWKSRARTDARRDFEEDTRALPPRTAGQFETARACAGSRGFSDLGRELRARK